MSALKIVLTIQRAGNMCGRLGIGLFFLAIHIINPWLMVPDSMRPWWLTAIHQIKYSGPFRPYAQLRTNSSSSIALWLRPTL
eukprot:scaffold9058_cov38-Cyclotella_meneghiniana.AAC.1